MGPWDPNRWLRNQGRGDDGADRPHFRQTTPTTTTRTSRSRCPPSRPPGAPLRGRALARLHGPRPAEWTSRPAFQSRATTLAARAPPSPTTRTTTQVRVRPPGLALLRSRHLRSSRLLCMPSRLALPSGLLCTPSRLALLSGLFCTSSRLTHSHSRLFCSADSVDLELVMQPAVVDLSSPPSSPSLQPEMVVSSPFSLLSPAPAAPTSLAGRCLVLFCAVSFRAVSFRAVSSPLSPVAPVPVPPPAVPPPAVPPPAVPPSGTPPPSAPAAPPQMTNEVEEQSTRFRPGCPRASLGVGWCWGPSCVCDENTIYEHTRSRELRRRGVLRGRQLRRDLRNPSLPGLI